jgi:hypothetical protein
MRVKRISIKSVNGIEVTDLADLDRKRKQIAEIFGIKTEAINCVYDEDTDEPEA